MSLIFFVINCFAAHILSSLYNSVDKNVRKSLCVINFYSYVYVNQIVVEHIYSVFTSFCSCHHSRSAEIPAWVYRPQARMSGSLPWFPMNLAWSGSVLWKESSGKTTRGRSAAVMNLHQVLTGAVNPGDNCFSVGSVNNVPFTVRYVKL